MVRMAEKLQLKPTMVNDAQWAMAEGAAQAFPRPSRHGQIWSSSA